MHKGWSKLDIDTTQLAATPHTDSGTDKVGDNKKNTGHELETWVCATYRFNYRFDRLPHKQGDTLTGTHYFLQQPSIT